VKAKFPDKLLAYNCSPSFNWKRHLDDPTIAGFQRELGAMGYAFQFVTLAGWHVLNLSTFELARSYSRQGMPAYVALQQREFAREAEGYTATRHQREVGAGYFDDVMTTLAGGSASTLALEGSTEQEQFSPSAQAVPRLSTAPTATAQYAAQGYLEPASTPPSTTSAAWARGL
jgi:isocitrate lyase